MKYYDPKYERGEMFFHVALLLNKPIKVSTSQNYHIVVV